MSDLIPEEETVKRIVQQIVQDNLSKKDVETIVKILAESASNASTSSSWISRFQRELANKIQKEYSGQCENEGINFPDHFSLKSVKERLDGYDVSNVPNLQVLTNIMIMLCIHSTEINWKLYVYGIEFMNSGLNSDFQILNGIFIIK